MGERARRVVVSRTQSTRDDVFKSTRVAERLIYLATVGECENHHVADMVVEAA